MDTGEREERVRSGDSWIGLARASGVPWTSAEAVNTQLTPRATET
jgi:hypothetical protein